MHSWGGGLKTTTNPVLVFLFRILVAIISAAAAGAAGLAAVIVPALELIVEDRGGMIISIITGWVVGILAFIITLVLVLKRLFRKPRPDV
jgi:hypothetical protein